ncbi:MAG: hypothetical protein ANABAC_1151 [Anaerolineae bacterium]|nr:MAG: hypothetical protein ANABAC_1151 [Anaerolineae bacterium]
MAGLGLGFLLHIVLANLLAHLFPFSIAYWLGVFLLLAGAVGLALRSPSRRPVLPEVKESVFIILAFFLLFGLFSLINRGLAIFDEGYNLPLVSRMAAGDVPPHFFFYPSAPMPYHYGLHLFAAALVRLGGLTVWSAFDLSRAFTHALMLILAGLWFWRMTQSYWKAVAGATIVYFAGGTQWLLLLVPPNWLARFGEHIPLINAAAVSGQNLLDVISRPWNIENGIGPLFPFAFISGIFLPQNLALTSTGACLALTIFLLLLLDRPNLSLTGELLLSLVLASLALTGEHLFVLVMAAIGIIWLTRVLLHPSGWNFSRLLGLFLPATILSLSMGGVMTVWVGRLISTLLGRESLYGFGLTGFRFYWPPAVMSVHFGRLELWQPYHLIVALAQMGPALVLILLSSWRLRNHWRRGRWLTTALVLSPWLGGTLSLFLEYQERAREITRFLDISLLLGVILALPLLLRVLPRVQRSLQWLILVGLGCLTFSGLATFAVQLLAIPTPQYTYFITPLDVQFSRKYWNTLSPQAQIFDPNAARSVVIFGRNVGLVSEDYRKPLPTWLQLVENFSTQNLAEAGYTHIYLDDQYWKRLSSVEKTTLERSCVKLVDSFVREEQFRSLYTIEDCDE